MNIDLFRKAIEDIRRIHNFEEDVNGLLRKFNTDGEYFVPTCEDMLVKVLQDSMNDTDEFISYFIYDLNFGKEWKEGNVVDNGKDIKLSTIDELYDYLIALQQ